MLDNEIGHIVPKRSFPSAAQLERFRDEMNARIGTATGGGSPPESRPSVDGATPAIE